MRRRTIGILGGMGPLATAEFYRQIVLRTPARRDHEHLHVIVDADPSIPDRTAALLGDGPDPSPHLVAAARRLEAAGADFLVIPCNTAHAFLPAVRAAVAIPVLDMIAEVAAVAARRFPVGTTVGVLATEGTIVARLYHRAFAPYDVRVIVPTAPAQRRVTRVIEAVKSGRLDDELRSEVSAVCELLVELGAEALVFACTELSVLMDGISVPVHTIDAFRVLADATIEVALGERPLPQLAETPLPG
ncbi:MAG: amino acid racemase [Thermomicrobium sp.]|nr:amino acid racemase [Thermomicrobium sp.]MDW8058637.1 amino acid racemase [Thermomicrobium sp.]